MEDAKTDSVNLAVNLGEGAVAPFVNGSVPDIKERLREADRRGVAPPQNWSTLAADCIEQLEERLINQLSGCSTPTSEQPREILIQRLEACQEILANERAQHQDSGQFTKSQLIRAFNSGYMLGHHDTVEGIFSEIHWSEMKIYHEDYVDDLIADDALPPDRSGISRFEPPAK